MMFTCCSVLLDSLDGTAALPVEEISFLGDWMMSLLDTQGCCLLVTLQRGWYQTENEYYLLQFTLTVRCLYYTSFSLELCWQQPPAARTFCSLPWMVAYVFYYPVFHNGPILSFPEFIAQVRAFRGLDGCFCR